MARFHLHLATLAAAILAPTGSAAPTSSSTLSYWLLHDYVPETFFNNFTFFSGPADPTHGTVNYLSSHKEAVNKQLIGTGTADDGTTTVKIAVDAKTKLQGNAGRNSIRITSKNKYNKGLFVFDVIHMPPSVCGLWPALWLLGEPEAEWPKNGEVDIIEGVNQQSGNLMTLHTKSDCKIGNSVSSTSTNPDAITYTGKRTTVNCNAYAGNGCQIAAPKGSSAADSTEQAANSYSSGATYGTALNAQGGAIVAVEWTTGGFKIWSWPRNSAPSSVKSTTASNPSNVTPSSDFGTPIAHFGGQGCAWNDNFKDLAFVINTDFCGDWAGNVDWNGGTCTKKTGYKTCSNYVRDHPEAFAQAYWEFGPVRYFAPSTSYGYSGSNFAGESSSDGSALESSNGIDNDDSSQLAGDVQNTTALVDDTYDALTSDTQNSTTPIPDAVPSTLLSISRLTSTPVSILASSASGSAAPSATNAPNLFAGMTETHVSSSLDVYRNASAPSSSSSRPSLIVPPFFHFNLSRPAASSYAVSSLVNVTSTPLPCAGYNATARLLGCSPRLPPYPNKALPRPSFTPFLNSSSSSNCNSSAVTSTSSTTAQGPTPPTASLMTSTTTVNPTTTLVVPAASSAAAGGMVEASLAALIAVMVFMVVFM